LQEFTASMEAGHETYFMEFDGIDPHSDRAHWHTHGRFIRDHTGAVERAVGITQNVTSAKRSQDALRLMAERLSTAELAAGAISYDFDATTGRLWRSDGVTRVLGWESEEIPMTVEGWAALKHPADRQMDASSGWGTQIGPDDHYIWEYRLLHKNGSYVWVQDAGRAFRNSKGQISRFTGVTIDISQRKMSEDAVRRQARLIDLSFDPIFVWHAKRGVVEWNNGAAQLFGYSRAEAIGKKSAVLLKTRNLPPLEAILPELRESGGWNGDIERTAKDGSIIQVECRLQIVENEGEVFVLETNHDITGRKRAEAHQHLMNRELAHRVKNSFAVLQAILRSTVKSASSPEEFAEAFSGRLQSLAAAQDILTASEWRGAELGALARHQLASYGAAPNGRIRISGPEVHLPPDLAAPMGLVFNELATNAIKYGALSTAAGAVNITWRVKGAGSKTRLVVDWVETGGPQVFEPERLGFGTTLIERSLATAKVTRRFLKEGLHCTLDMDIYPAGAKPS
jgi:PAS domain S-box-containing protein